MRLLYFVMILPISIAASCELTSKTSMHNKQKKEFLKLNKKGVQDWLSKNKFIELNLKEIEFGRVLQADNGEVLVVFDVFEDGALYGDMKMLQDVLKIEEFEGNPFTENESLFLNWNEDMANEHIDTMLNLINYSIHSNESIEKTLSSISFKINEIHPNKENDYKICFLGCGALLGHYLSEYHGFSWIVNKNETAENPLLKGNNNEEYYINPWFRMGKSLRKDDGDLDLYALYKLHLTSNKLGIMTE